MTGRIDPLIALHFQDRIEQFGPDQQDCLVSFRPGADIRALAAQYGATVSRTDDRIAVLRGPSSAQTALQSATAILSVVPVGRTKEVAVLVRVQSPVWHGEIPGFKRGSQLGYVVTGTATQNAIAALAHDPDVVSVEVSRAADDDRGAIECVHSMPFVRAGIAHGPNFNESGSEALVAIIDIGIDVLHETFRVPRTAQTRILAIWDQRAAAGPGPQQAAAAGTAISKNYTQNYGRYHSQADINGYLAANTVPIDFDRDPDMHGTHVASIAAGSPFGSFPGGVAPEAGIIVVIPKIATAPGDSASIGYSKSHVDALAFVKETARALEKPVAVNVSLGMNAGAHDGTSLLELAFDEFSGGGRVPGLVLVKSAGNEQMCSIRAQANVTAGGTANIEWDSSSTPRREDFLEFWSASSDSLRFTLHVPGGAPVVVDRAHPNEQTNLPMGETCYLSLERFYRDNGDTRLLVLIRRNNNTALTLAGKWRLEIFGGAVAAGGGRVDGWIERVNSRPLRFTTSLARTGTLSIPGTARTVICVGACDLDDPPTVQAFSSRGPSRDARNKPELVAPGHDITAARAGTTNGTVAMPGTSMAAPHVAGAVALLLSRRQRNPAKPPLNAAQVRSALSQCLGGFSGQWDAGRGYGWLDIPALLEAFD